MLGRVFALCALAALAATQLSEARLATFNATGALAAFNGPVLLTRPDGTLKTFVERAREVAQMLGPHYDPEIDMTATEIILYHGYPAQEIYAVTEDGYILTLHRIPHGRDGPSLNRPVIFLQHGLEDCSTSWIINQPNQSAGFMLADAGFDVYMGNMRGNRYSRRHLTLSPKSREFWRFSFDEMVKYDLQAMIDTALKTSNASSLYYVGHSQGTLTMFAKLSRDPAFSQKIRKFFALAPVAHVKHIRGMLHVLATLLFDDVKTLHTLFGDHEFLPTGKMLDIVAKHVCNTRPGAHICGSFVEMLMGVDADKLNSTRMPVYVSHIPSGTSVKNILHWASMVRSGVFTEYDYGRIENHKRYKQSHPPLYDIALDNVPIHMYWSPVDWLADEQDIEEYIIPTLRKSVVVENVKLHDFNHVDFLWSLRAADVVYKPIIETCREDVAFRQAQNQA